MSNQVSHYNFTQAGAPTLSGTAGSLIAVLDACLVNGWGAQNATSLTVSGTTATLTLPSTPAMVVHGLVNISGATLTGFVNGDYKVLTITGNVLTFAVSGVTAGTATGTIVAKVAALGWVKAFSGTNKAVYKSGNPAATGCYMRVDDTGTQTARVVFFESMTDVDTGTATFWVNAGGSYISKSSTANSTARQWHIVGDDRLVYMTCGSSNTADFVTNNLGAKSWAFGDPIPLNSGDTAYSYFHCGSNNSAVYNETGAANDDLSLAVAPTNVQSPQCIMARSYTQTGFGITVGKLVKGLCTTNGVGSGTTNAGFAFPNAANSGLLLSRMAVGESTTARADLPGIFFIPQNIGTTFANRDMLDGVGSLSGRKVMFLRTSGPGATGMAGGNFFDITGPWR